MCLYEWTFFLFFSSHFFRIKIELQSVITQYESIIFEMLPLLLLSAINNVYTISHIRWFIESYNWLWLIPASYVNTSFFDVSCLIILPNETHLQCIKCSLTLSSNSKSAVPRVTSPPLWVYGCMSMLMCAGHLGKHEHISIRFFKIQSTALCARFTSGNTFKVHPALWQT